MPNFKIYLYTTAIALTFTAQPVLAAADETLENPAAFGGVKGRRIFDENSKKVINIAVDATRGFKEKGEVERSSFDRIMAYLAKQRGNIAKGAKSPDCENFGAPRLQPNQPPVFLTGLGERKELSAVSQQTAQDALRALLLPTADFTAENDEMRLTAIPQTAAEWPFLEQWEIPGLQHHAVQGELEAQVRLIDYGVLVALFRSLGSRAVQNQVGTLQLQQRLLLFKAQIQKEGTPLTTFYFVGARDEEPHDGVSETEIANIFPHPVGQVLHTPNDSIETLTERSAGLWRQALELDPEEDSFQAALQRTLAELRYVESHTMRYARGSAAITNWLMASVLGVYGLKEEIAEGSDWAELDYHTLGKTFSNFLEGYMENVHFVPVEDEASDTDGARAARAGE